MASGKTSKNSSALKQAPKTPKTNNVREFLNRISIDLESCPKHEKSELKDNHFAWGASQVNTDLALAAQCESEGDIGIEDDNYFDFFRSSEYQKLQRTFKEEVEDDASALVNMVWRAYNAGLLSPERLEPDSAYVRAERRRIRDYWNKEHEKVMAAKQAAK
jgi:hypothetical protein